MVVAFEVSDEQRAALARLAAREGTSMKRVGSVLIELGLEVDAADPSVSRARIAEGDREPTLEERIDATPGLRSVLVALAAAGEPVAVQQAGHVAGLRRTAGYKWSHFLVDHELASFSSSGSRSTQMVTLTAEGHKHAERLRAAP